MIEIAGLEKAYHGKKALRGIDLHVGEGELFAFLGPNGAGKTTTIRILTGLTRLDRGTVRIGGYDILTDSLGAKRSFGLVPQRVNLDRELSVGENLLVHGRLHHMPRRRIARRTDQLLEYVEMKDYTRTPVKELSGGMQRRVMIARALLHEPGVLFLDEPTVGLDADIRRRTWALIKRIQLEGVTIFLTTHYIEEAEFLAGRVAFIDQGRIVALDTPQNLISGIGNWAMDRFVADNIRTSYYATREDAGAELPGEDNGGFTLRRVNLEDAFLAMTGKKVA